MEGFYALALIRELSLDHTNSGINQICFPVHENNHQAISGHIIFLRNKLNFVVDREKKKLHKRNFIDISLYPGLSYLLFHQSIIYAIKKHNIRNNIVATKTC